LSQSVNFKTMESSDKYTVVYAGSEVNVQYLENIFTEEKIAFRVRNDFESALRAGFAAGVPGQAILLVPESDLAKATRIVEDVFPEALNDEEE